MSLSEVSSALYKELNSLMAPALVPRVGVNSTTPYDEKKEVQETFSKESFRVDRRESKLLDFSEKEEKITKTTQEVVESFTKTEYPPDVAKYSANNNLNNNIIKNSLNNGYSVQEAMNIKTAVKSYGVNESFYKNGNNYISTQSCDV